MWQLVANWFIKLIARVISDWRRDNLIEEKGRADQRNDDFEEGERRRQEADQVTTEVEGDDVSVGSGEL